jgi:hypothetical protein
MLAVVAPSSAGAQFARRYVAFSVGATHSDLSDYLFNLGWRWGGTAGVHVGVVSFDYANLELAPAWIRAGGGDIRLDYADVPVMLGAMLAVGRDVYVRPYGGLSLAVRFGCGGGQTQACDVARRTTWSVPSGLSVIKVLESGDLVGIDARYVLGLSNVFTVTDATQRSWQLRILFGRALGDR